MECHQMARAEFHWRESGNEEEKNRLYFRTHNCGRWTGFFLFLMGGAAEVGRHSGDLT